uniref:CCHC-type domain-containing protein n=1 Tax=Ipomoea trifida TaxID=35884 RepID=A0A8Z2_IPOTF|nr:hypothetical protein [Ipomoea trifida]
MSSITKREFTELSLDGGNYLTWALDIEIHLASKGLSQTIVAMSQCTDAQKAQALIFLRHHLNHDLKNEYLTEKDPFALWKFQDYKSVIDYNSALHKIVSQLKLCKQEVSEKDLIEKTLSTFHASNLVLQQQYRAKNYEKHSELISALLVAEKHNQLLMKNHNARSGSNSRRGRGRGRGRGHGRNNRSGRGKGGNDSRVQDKKRSDQGSSRSQTCYRCGCEGHWSRTCRTPKHLVEAYKMMQRKNDKQPSGRESHHTNTNLPEANAVMNDDDDDLLKYELEDFGDQE